MNKDYIFDFVDKTLTDKRKIHTEGVRKMALKLCDELIAANLLYILIGKINIDSHLSEDVLDVISNRNYLLSKTPVKLIGCYAERLLTPCFYKINNSFSLRQIELAVKKGKLGKFTGICNSCTG